MTAPVSLVERLAEAFRSAAWLEPRPSQGQPEWAAFEVDALHALLPVVEQEIAAARAEALRSAAKEAEERGDIGKDGGCEAWTWLRIRAGRIGGAE